MAKSPKNQSPNSEFDTSSLGWCVYSGRRTHHSPSFEMMTWSSGVTDPGGLPLGYQILEKDTMARS